MNTSSKALIYSLVCMVSLSIQAQTVKEYYDSARVYIQKNNYQAAMPWLEKAKTLAVSVPGDSGNQAEIIKLLAIAYAKVGDNAKAEMNFKQAMEIYEKMPSRASVYVTFLSNFGVFYYNQKKFAEAEPIFAQAVNLKKSLSGEKNAEYITILNSLANTYLNLQKYNYAESAFQSIADLRCEVNGAGSAEYLAALNSLGNVYRMMSRHEKALPVYVQALEITKKLKGENSKDYAVVAGQLALAYKNVANYYDAEQYYQVSLQKMKELQMDRSKDYSSSLINMAGIYRAQGKYEAAEPLYTSAQELMLAIGAENTSDYALLLNNIALYYGEIGKYEQSEVLYKQSLDISRKILGEKHPETATTYNNLGILYQYMGRYDQSEALLNKAKGYRKEVLGEKHIDYAASQNNLASLYEKMGRYSEAEPLYAQALALIKSNFGTRNSDYASTLNNLAGVYDNLKKYEKAEAMYNEALIIIKEIYGESHPDYSSTINNLALLLEATGKKSDAEKLHKFNLDVLKQSMGEKHPNYASAMHNYGVLLARLARYGDAEKALSQALTLKSEILGKFHPSLATTMYELAKLHAATKNYTKADEYWDKTLGTHLIQIEEYFPSLSEKEKTKFYATIAPRFEQFNSYALIRRKSNPEYLGKMYDYQLATKALLLNSTNKVRQRILSSGDPGLIKQYRNWLAKKESLAKSYSMSKEEIVKNNINLDDLATEVNDMEKELNARSEIFRGVNDVKKASWIDIQSRLRDGEIAIEMIRFVKFKFDSSGAYSEDSIRYAALLLKSGDKHPSLVLLTKGKEMENQYVKFYRNSIKSRSTDELSYQAFWGEISKELSKSKIVFFSPDGVYNQLNINTLYNNQTKKFVADEWELRFLTNTKELLSASSAKSKPEKSIVLIGSPDFAMNTREVQKRFPGIPMDQALNIERSGATVLDPLPGTKIEVEKIYGMLKKELWKLDIYTEQNATEDNLKRVANPGVIHIATHGFFEADNGETNKAKTKKKDEQEVIDNPLLKSGLYLAGSSLTILKRKNLVTATEYNEAGREDGVLTAYEAMNLSLEKTDLVVLSACETGLGEVKNGEGVYGLQRAFQVAGAKAIIISLWTVSDNATQKLMTNFYKEWMQTGNKRQAFINAQMALRKEFQDPYYWGAFVMVGN